MSTYRVSIYEPHVDPGGYCDVLDVEADSENEAINFAKLHMTTRYPEGGPWSIDKIDKLADATQRVQINPEAMVEVCPGCNTTLGPAICHFYFSTWDCWGCGATIDGRVSGPKLVKATEAKTPLGEPLA